MILSVLLLCGALALLVLELGNPKRFRVPLIAVTALLVVQVGWRLIVGGGGPVEEQPRDAALAQVMVEDLIEDLKPAKVVVIQHHDDNGFYSSFNHLQDLGIQAAIAESTVKISVFKPDAAAYGVDMHTVLENHFWRKDFMEWLATQDPRPDAILSFIGFPTNLPVRVLDVLPPLYVYDLYGSEDWEESNLRRQALLKYLVRLRYDVDAKALARAKGDARKQFDERFVVTRY